MFKTAFTSWNKHVLFFLLFLAILFISLSHKIQRLIFSGAFKSARFKSINFILRQISFFQFIFKLVPFFDTVELTNSVPLFPDTAYTVSKKSSLSLITFRHI